MPDGADGGVAAGTASAIKSNAYEIMECSLSRPTGEKGRNGMQSARIVQDFQRDTSASIILRLGVIVSERGSAAGQRMGRATRIPASLRYLCR